MLRTFSRSDKAWKAIFDQAGLKLVREQVQNGLPEGLYVVKMYVSYISTGGCCFIQSTNVLSLSGMPFDELSGNMKHNASDINLAILDTIHLVVSKYGKLEIQNSSCVL